MIKMEMDLSVNGHNDVDISEAEENDDVRVIPKLVEQDWMASLEVHFGTNHSAQIALNSLKPDIEPRVGCYRELTCVEQKLVGLFSAPDPKGLSISLRGFLDHVILIESCFKRFCPDSFKPFPEFSHVCTFRLGNNCEQFAGNSEKFFEDGKRCITASGCSSLSEQIHEYLKVFVENMAVGSDDKNES